MLEISSGGPSDPNRLIFACPGPVNMHVRRLMIERGDHKAKAMSSVHDDHASQKPKAPLRFRIAEGRRYALFFSRFRFEISAISMGPTLNSPSPAFRVNSRR